MGHARTHSWSANTDRESTSQLTYPLNEQVLTVGFVPALVRICALAVGTYGARCADSARVRARAKSGRDHPNQ